MNLPSQKKNIGFSSSRCEIHITNWCHPASKSKGCSCARKEKSPLEKIKSSWTEDQYIYIYIYYIIIALYTIDTLIYTII